MEGCVNLHIHYVPLACFRWYSFCVFSYPFILNIPHYPCVIFEPRRARFLLILPSSFLDVIISYFLSQYGEVSLNGQLFLGNAHVGHLI